MSPREANHIDAAGGVPGIILWREGAIGGTFLRQREGNLFIGRPIIIENVALKLVSCVQRRLAASRE